MDLQTAFDSTCRVLFGSGIGKLHDFEPYLKEMMMPFQVHASALSGKGVVVSHPYYPQDAKYVSQEEIASLKFAPLNINEIKDVDSLFAAAAERAVYCGNKVFGGNFSVSEVDNCVDCSNVHFSHNVFHVKNGAYLSQVREAENVFGMGPHPKCKFTIRSCEGIDANRCFEEYSCANISDMYYAINCIGCQNCIFAFNLRSKKNVIGNLELAQDKFLTLKKKLLAEMAQALRKNKRLFSLADIAFMGREKKDVPEETLAYDSPVPPKVEEGFRSTCRIVLGHEHHDIRKYGAGMLKRVLPIKKVKGAFGNPSYKVGLPTMRDIPADRLVSLEESKKCAQMQISIAQNEQPSLQQTALRASKIAYFAVEFIDGQNINCTDTPDVFTGSNIYKCWDSTNSKTSAYASAAIESEYIFGGYLRMLHSAFCINCFDSTKLKNSFEVDSTYSSSNAYFCHNCENVQNAIFCFNAKALNYAVLNQQVSKEEFERIRKMLLDYVNRELGEKGECGATIFCIGKGK